MNYIIVGRHCTPIIQIRDLIDNIHKFHCDVTCEPNKAKLLRRENRDKVKIIYVKTSSLSAWDRMVSECGYNNEISRMNFIDDQINFVHECFEDCADFIIDIDNMNESDVANTIWERIRKCESE